ncbi:MAG: M23 family metallopeptidase [Clostridia bacterium]|nr:M23 family metallopeptidase [Clostridia bacterium]
MDTERIKVEFATKQVYPAGSKRRSLSAKQALQRRRKKPGASRAKVRWGVCAAAIVLALGIRYFPGETAAKVRSWMGSLISYDIQWEKLGETKFVQAVFPSGGALFADADRLIWPVDGTVTRKYEENGLQNIAISGAPNADVVAAETGTMVKRGIDETHGNYIRLRHPSGKETIYYGLTESALQKEDRVEKGQTVGKLGFEGVLVFELRIGDRPCDPLQYLGIQ